MNDKSFRITVVVLLVLMLGMQAFAIFAPEPGPSQDCLTALKDARSVSATVTTATSAALENYKTDVYDRADNINQQILLSNENSFLLQHAALQIQQSLVKVSLACE